VGKYRPLVIPVVVWEVVSSCDLSLRSVGRGVSEVRTGSTTTEILLEGAGEAVGAVVV
jgi:hypothetical protein